VDPASIAVRETQAGQDGQDRGETLLRTLLLQARRAAGPARWVVAPSPEEEDRRGLPLTADIES